MRTTRQQVTGTTGELGASADFAAIGWLPVRNACQEMGTDLLVAARDSRLFDRVLIVGVQVKAGPSAFDEPKTGEGGELSGWWFREDSTRHFDDWVTHGLPHLVVLHCREARVSYWVHVTANAVVSTGKGCKILVPSDQTIDAEHADALLAVASTQKRAPELERTAYYASAGSIGPGRRLRYALVAPRLVARHPDAGHSRPIDSVEAVALLAQGRFRALKGFAERHSGVPDPEEPAHQLPWHWRFVAAMWDWAIKDSTAHLREVFDCAPDETARAASGVLLACALQRVEQHGPALGLLDSLVARDDLIPADHGWVLVQRARTRLEIGDTAGARDDATEAQRTFVAEPDDLTVSALTASAAWLLFSTAWIEGHSTPATNDDDAETEEPFAQLVTASDTAVSWWRSQTLARALAQAEMERFRTWAVDQQESHGGSPSHPGQHGLFGAELNADITGDHRTWRGVSELAAQQRLLSAADSGDRIAALADGLDGLRRCGSRESLELALKHLRRVGPLEAVQRAMNKIPITGWTHTTAGRNLDALALAGDLVEEQTATQHLCRITRLVEGETADFIARVRPNFHVPHFAAKALAGLLPAVEGSGHGRVARLVASLPVSAPEYLLSSVTRRIVGQLDYDQVTAADREALWIRGQQDSGHLGSHVLGWLADNGHLAARRNLIDRAAGGDSYALAALPDARSLDTTDAASIIEACEDLVQETLRNARRGSYRVTGPDHSSALACLNLWFPEQARWNEVIDLLLEARVVEFRKLPTVWLIAESADELPPEVRTVVSENIDSVAAARTLGNASSIQGLGVVLAIALGVTEGSDADIAAARLAAGTAQQRQYAAMLLGLGHCPASRPILAALVRDRNSDVRYEAAEAVGKLATNTQDNLFQALASDIAQADGTLVPSALLNGISTKAPPLPSRIERVATRLLQHRSALIRNHARRLLST